MINLRLEEAQLLRLLTSFFGGDHVFHSIGVKCVCNKILNKLPNLHLPKGSDKLDQWIENNQCLFTIVDLNDDPCLVIEFTYDFSGTIDMRAYEHQIYLKPLLKKLDIPYLLIDPDEFNAILDPKDTYGLYDFLKDRYENSASKVIAK